MTTTTTLIPREFTPKRGIKPVLMTIVNESIQFKVHHQKTLILTLLKETSTKSMTLPMMVKKVEEDETLKSLLQSKQSVFNCITYHMKDLAKLGVLKLTEGTSAPEPEVKKEETVEVLDEQDELMMHHVK